MVSSSLTTGSYVASPRCCLHPAPIRSDMFRNVPFVASSYCLSHSRALSPYSLKNSGYTGIGSRVALLNYGKFGRTEGVNAARGVRGTASLIALR